MSSIKMPPTEPPGKLDVVQLRTQHIRTLEVLHSVMEGHADLTGQLQAAQRAAKSELDAAERARIAAAAQAEAAATIARLEDEAKVRNEHVIDLERQLALAWKKAGAEADGKLKAARAELDGLRKTAAAAAAELQARLDAALGERNERGVKIAKLKTELDEARKGARDVAGDAAGRAQALAAAKEDADQLRASLKACKAQCKGLEGDLELARARARDADATWKEKLAAERKRLERDARNAKADVAALRKKLAAAVESCAALRAREEAAHDALAQANVARVECEGQRDAARNRCAALREEVAALTAKLAELQPKASASGKSRFGQFVELKEQNQALQREVKQLKKGPRGRRPSGGGGGGRDGGGRGGDRRRGSRGGGDARGMPPVPPAAQPEQHFGNGAGGGGGGGARPAGPPSSAFSKTVARQQAREGALPAAVRATPPTGEHGGSFRRRR